LNTINRDIELVSRNTAVSPKMISFNESLSSDEHDELVKCCLDETYRRKYKSRFSQLLSRVEKSLIEESEPTWITEAFVQKPGKCLFGSLFVCIALSLLSFLLGFLKLEGLHERDFLIWKDETTTNYDMINLANDWADEKEGIVNENQRVEQD
jgi:hypothetical protein